jgi:hypothetical protein
VKFGYCALLSGLALFSGCGAKTPPTPSPSIPEATVSARPAPAAAATATPAGSPGFDKQLELNGIGFHVRSPNVAAGNTVDVAPAGLEIDNSPFTSDADGAVTGAEVADLDADGSPEIYVFVTSTDATARGSVVAFSANKRKSLSSIYLPPMAETPAAAQGYQGHDDFAVVEGSLVRRFPIYAGEGVGAAPTGKTRQLQYKLVPGEAGWILKLDRTTDF